MANLVNLQKIRVKPTLLERGRDFAIIIKGNSETRYKIDIDRLQDWLVANELNVWHPVPWEEVKMDSEVLALQDCTTIPKEDLIAYCDELQVDYENARVSALYMIYEGKKIEIFKKQNLTLPKVVQVIKNIIPGNGWLFKDRKNNPEKHLNQMSFRLKSNLVNRCDVKLFTNGGITSLEFNGSSVNPRFYH